MRLRARWWAGWSAVVGVVVASVGCASTGAGGPRTGPPPGATVAASAVPPPAAKATGPIAQAWEELRSGSTEEAAALLVALPPAQLGDPMRLTVAGFLALRRGDPAAAQDAFGAALAARPDLGEAAYGMALVAQGRGDRPLTRRWLQSALASEPGLTRAAIALQTLQLQAVESDLFRAEEAEAAGDGDAALAAYRAAIQRAPLARGVYARAASVQQRAGDVEGAMATLRQGLSATGDSLALLRPLADLLAQTGRLAEAADAYQRLSVLAPGDAELAAAARAARDRYEQESLPIEYRALAGRSVITREELAAVLAINLQGLGGRVSADTAVIVSDSSDRWSTPFIQRMVQWGVLDVYQNDFMPEMEVRRSMLVEACYRVVELLGLADSAPRPRLQDPPPEHLLYRPVQVVVGLGLMLRGSDGSFDLLAPVSGAEALSTAEKLAALVRRQGT